MERTALLRSLTCSALFRSVLLCFFFFFITVLAMDWESTNSSEISIDLSPFLIIYKDGRVERLIGLEVVPAGVDPNTGVKSKDVVISPETGVSARLYIPKITYPSRKLPLLVYVHGGGFCIETAFSPTYHNYLNILVAEAKVVVVSVDYRRAPEHSLPAGYDDSWAAVKWVASDGADEWIKAHADLRRVFFAGDSSGANVVHHMGLRAGKEDPGRVKLRGVVLVHPFFWGNDPIGGEPKEPEERALAEGLWHLAYPATSGLDDPWINPAKDPNLKSMGCGKVLVCVAGKDVLKDRGWYYYETMWKSGWDGVVEFMESQGEEHVFHLQNPTSKNALALLKRMSYFFNQE